MYTIKMNSDKSLIKTVITNLYQREKLIDKIQFIIPLNYGDIELSDFTVVLKYIDQSNTPHAEILVKDEEIYKENYYRYVLPIDTALTKFAGDIELRLTLTKVDLETKKQYILHTTPVTITILPVEDYYNFVPDESLEFVDQIVGALEAKMEALSHMSEEYNSTKVDDVILDTENNTLHLSSNHSPIGEGISLEELKSELSEVIL